MCEIDITWSPLLSPPAVLHEGISPLQVLCQHHVAGGMDLSWCVVLQIGARSLLQKASTALCKCMNICPTSETASVRAVVNIKNALKDAKPLNAAREEACHRSPSQYRADRTLVTSDAPQQTAVQEGYTADFNFLTLTTNV